MNENQEKGNFVLIDAYNLIYRAFHGNMSPMKNPEGLPTNAIYTVCKMLQKIKRENTMKYAICVFDGAGGNNARREIDENYKINRKPMPEDLKKQMPYIKQAIELLGWPTYQAVDAEADDVIATLAQRAAAKGFNASIVSGDKDFRAIVNDNICVIDTMNNIIYNEAMVIEKMGIRPDQVTDYLSLMGDSVDNVIGIDKLGPKTAVKLLTQYDTLENIIANAHEVKGVVGDNLRKSIVAGQLSKNKQLITLNCAVPLNLKVKDITPLDINQQPWEDFCKIMNFKSFNTTAAKVKV